MHSRISDDDLLTRTCRGDADAFACFYDRHLSAIVAYLMERTRDPEITADLTAEVFAAALVSCERFRPGGPPALAWLYGIAANKLLESLRRGRVEEEARRRLAWQPQQLEDHDLRTIEALAAHEHQPQLLAAVSALAPEQRAAILSRVVDGQDYEEIAQRLQCSTAVVRQRVSRGLRALRTQLGEAP